MQVFVAALNVALAIAQTHAGPAVRTLLTAEPATGKRANPSEGSHSTQLVAEPAHALHGAVHTIDYYEVLPVQVPGVPKYP